MLASGVVVPQRQALRAAAFPAVLVREAIRAAVTDADRQLLQHHAHPAPPKLDSESPAMPAVWQPTSDQRPPPRRVHCPQSGEARRIGLRGFPHNNGIQPAEQSGIELVIMGVIGKQGEDWRP